MSEFGDAEPADAFDIEPADPVQVARKLAELDGIDFDHWTGEERARRIGIALALIVWLRREGSMR